MKKSFLFLAILIANQSFATTDITGNSASCDSGVLGVETGGVALKADYSPETIELRWYDDIGRQIAVTSEYASCTYNEAINIPTAPTKTGYKFAGWKVRPKYDFSTLDYNIGTSWDATHTRWKPINGSDGRTMQSEFGTENSSDLSNGQWSDTFSYGTVIGNALCSDSSDNGKTFAQTGNPGNAITGQYCWCMATGYKPDGSDVVYSPNSSLSWVFNGDAGSASTCAYHCAINCAYAVQLYSGPRRAIFGVTQ